MKYHLVMKFKTGDLYSGVREIENSVNKYMEDFGFPEKMSYQTEAPMFTLESDHVLSFEEKRAMMAKINSHFETQPIKMECTNIIED